LPALVAGAAALVMIGARVYPAFHGNIETGSAAERRVDGD